MKYNAVKLISLRIEDELAEKIDEVARKTLQTRSEIIRGALGLYLTLLENIGFYFKPSLPMKNVDVYEERNAVNVDLGNLTSVCVFNVSYGGVGELELDLKRDLSFVAKVMANQIAVEAYCRFVSPLLVLLASTCRFGYTYSFFRELSQEVMKKLGVRVALTGCEDVFETRQSGFVATLVGLRDMRVKNSPKRGDKVYFYGSSVAGEMLREEHLLNIDRVKNFAEMVRRGVANSIFPVKSGGLEEVANFAASLAGGRAILFDFREGCPATAVVLTSQNDLTDEGCELVGEIL